MDSPASRLKQVRLERGYRSARAAALRFGWGPSTYTSHENGHRGLTRAFGDYAKKYRVSEAWLLGLTDDRDTGVKGAPIMGEAAIGVWRDASAGTPQKPADSAYIDIPLIEGEDLDDVRYSVRVADNSVDKSVSRGSYAICEPCPSQDHSIHHLGDLLYIERTRQGMRETSLRRVSHVASERLKLSTHSREANLKQELSFPAAGGEHIRLLGRVVGIYTDFKPRRD